MADAPSTPLLRSASAPPASTMKTVTDLGLGAGSETIACDICVIGAGSGGLSVASAAAQLGSDVVLIEKHKMGGDCLNYGCVPSKALIAAARRAHVMRTSLPFGIRPVAPSVDMKGVHDHIKAVIKAIEPNDSVERFTGLGVRVIQGAAKFIDAQTVGVGDRRITARRFVVATGSTAAVPPIPGLDSVPYFTNETLFDNQQPITHLIVVGAGPIGLEMAQAYHRLGAAVTVLDGATALAKDDPELTAVALKGLIAEGLVIKEGARIERIEGGLGRIRAIVTLEGETLTIDGSHLLIAAGRKPNVTDLGLEAAGITYDRTGIKVDAGMTTSNRRVSAIGDVTGGAQFTHVANAHAGTVIRRLLFRLPAKTNPDIVPWVTFIDPELAQVGLTEAVARKRYGKVHVYRWPFHENDRAQAERETEGLVKVVTDPRGRILGAGIVGAHAGELIQMWSLAISQGMNIKAMTEWISPYPTFSEVNKRAAFGIYAGKAANPSVRRLLAFLRRFG
jgi:pyruvate/2-oxoglutarate dehydrogenase complex dihydrolipoamide dehydrogenase (E3) component